MTSLKLCEKKLFQERQEYKLVLNIHFNEIESDTLGSQLPPPAPMQRLFSVAWSWGTMFLFCDVIDIFWYFWKGKGPHPVFSQSGLVSPSPLSLPFLLFGYHLEVTQTTHSPLLKNIYFCLHTQFRRLGVTPDCLCTSLCISLSFTAMQSPAKSRGLAKSLKSLMHLSTFRTVDYSSSFFFFQLILASVQNLCIDIFASSLVSISIGCQVVSLKRECDLVAF